MRTISEIYDSYRIPPWLAEHMYRVAAVAMQIFDAHKVANSSLEGRDDLMSACLLHDMGNILKFNFTLLPPPDGRLEYWKGVKDDMTKKYGASETHATAMIIEELGVSAIVLPILKYTSDQEVLVLETEGTFLQKIAAYADQRVSPKGIIPLAQRLDEMRVRYAHPDDDHHRALNAATFRLERELFEGISLLPDAITEQSSVSFMESLKSFEIRPA